MHTPDEAHFFQLVPPKNATQKFTCSHGFRSAKGRLETMLFRILSLSPPSKSKGASVLHSSQTIDIAQHVSQFTMRVLYTIRGRKFKPSKTTRRRRRSAFHAKLTERVAARTLSKQTLFHRSLGQPMFRTARYPRPVTRKEQLARTVCHTAGRVLSVLC